MLPLCIKVLLDLTLEYNASILLTMDFFCLAVYLFQLPWADLFIFITIYNYYASKLPVPKTPDYPYCS